MGRAQPSSRITRKGRHTGALFAAFLGAALLSGPAAGQTLEGVLIERGSNRPVDLAVLLLHTVEGDSVDSTISNEGGRFRLFSPEPGEFLLTVVALGYRTRTTGVFDLGEDARLSVEFRVDAVPIELPGLEVEAASPLLRRPRLVQNGFAARAQSGLGTFITPGMLESDVALALPTSEIFRSTNRVDVQATPRGPRLRMIGPAGYCTPVGFLDGVRIDMASTNIDEYVRRQDLEAVEIYRTGAQAPLQYGGTTQQGCGVIVMWTRYR